MIKSTPIVALAIIASSSAQVAKAPRRLRGSNAVAQKHNVFGRTTVTAGKNSNMKQRVLQDASMSMASTVVDTPAPTEWYPTYSPTSAPDPLNAAVGDVEEQGVDKEIVTGVVHQFLCEHLYWSYWGGECL